VTPPGVVFHVMNRAAKKSRLFESVSDYRAFVELLSDAVSRFDVAVFSYIVMPNHWHFLLSADVDSDLSRFMHWLEGTHARRWVLAKGVCGQGAVYQGRFKAIAIQTERHFVWVCRYVERNALRANLVDRAEAWRWSSLWQRQNDADGPRLADWPVSRPDDWLTQVNTPQTDAELEAFRHALTVGQSFGDTAWLIEIGHGVGRPRGRPRRCPQKMTPDPIYL
jgi:REP-associated tyrosine transposase